MKKHAFLLLLVFLQGIYVCAQTSSSKQWTTVKYYYSGGKTEVIRTKNADSLFRNYHHANRGLIDSMITFRNGKRNGATKIIVQNGLTVYQEYKNGILKKEQWFDSTQKLIYSDPLNINALGKTDIWLSSGRKYFSRELGDTILVMNTNVPPANWQIAIIGMPFFQLSDNAYIVKPQPADIQVKEIIVRVHISAGNSSARSKKEEVKFEIK